MEKLKIIFQESKIGKFLLPLGIILLYLSLSSFIKAIIIKDYIKIDAVVSKVEVAKDIYTDETKASYDDSYRVYVKYKIDDNEYEEELGIFNGYKKNDKLTISYNKDNPKDIALPISMAWPIIFAVFGFPTFIGGLVCIIIVLKRHKKLLEEESSKDK